MWSKFMPYQLAISVGAASSAAQPASFFTTSPWLIVTIDRLTLIAAVSIFVSGAAIQWLRDELKIVDQDLLRLNTMVQPRIPGDEHPGLPQDGALPVEH